MGKNCIVCKTPYMRFAAQGLDICLPCDEALKLLGIMTIAKYDWWVFLDKLKVLEFISSEELIADFKRITRYKGGEYHTPKTNPPRGSKNDE